MIMPVILWASLQSWAGRIDYDHELREEAGKLHIFMFAVNFSALQLLEYA